MDYYGGSVQLGKCICIYSIVLVLYDTQVTTAGIWVTTRDRNPLHAKPSHYGTSSHDNTPSNQHGTSSSSTRRSSIFHSYKSELLEKNIGIKSQSVSKGETLPIARGQHVVLEGQRQSPKGQSAPNCMYSFIVNELDSSKCPLLLQQMQNMQNEQPKDKYRQEMNDEDYKNLEELSSRMETLETKLYQEIAENRNIEKDILQQDTLVKRTEQVMKYHQHNITMLMSAVRRLEITLGKQKVYWKNVDNKLAGVMLDVIEINNRLDKKKNQLQMAPAAKSIDVEASSRISCSGINNATTRFKGDY